MEDKFYYSVIKNSPMGYAYHRIITDGSGDPIDYELLEINPAFEKITGLKAPDILGKKVTELFPDIKRDSFDWIGFYGQIALKGSRKEFNQYSEYNDSWFRVYAYSPELGYFITLLTYITDEFGELINAEEKSKTARNKKYNSIIVASPVDTRFEVNRVFQEANDIVRDISAREQTEAEIYKQRAQFEALFTNTNDAMVFFDLNEAILNINSQFTQLFGYLLEEVAGKNVNAIVDPFKKMKDYGSPHVLQGQTIMMETIRYSKTGQAIPVSLKGGPVYIDGSICGGYVVYVDITERKRYEEELKYLSLHDKLTGLYNRAFFEEELNRLDWSRDYPITIISADVDGLKLINDSVGHAYGDKILKACAQILQASLRSSDILARIGGDEFTVLLPKTNEKTGETIMKRIYNKVGAYNKTHPNPHLSLSIGLATAADQSVNLEETAKRADDSMYRSKLHKAMSAKSKIIDTLMKALGERDYITEGHGKRLTVFCQKIGEAMGLNSGQLDNLALLAQVHDLGKVGLPDKILFKEGSLTEDEWKIMREHPVKGYRIAMSSPDLSGIADLILKHHEKWDGTGYPLGLKGEDIPVECRILAIVDAFDAMTNDRPYSKARSMAKAVAELRDCAGTQFDPDLTVVFLAILEERQYNAFTD